MNALGHRLARTLIAWCAALFPVRRSVWVEAMRAEVQAINDGKAAALFAVGCLWAAFKEGAFTLSFAARTLNLATIAALLAISALAAVLTKEAMTDALPKTFAFGITSALFVTVAIMGYRRGPWALIRAGRLLILVNVLAYACLSQMQGALTNLDQVSLYRALAAEGVVIWTAVLASSALVLRLTHVLQNRTIAR